MWIIGIVVAVVTLPLLLKWTEEERGISTLEESYERERN